MMVATTVEKPDDPGMFYPAVRINGVTHVHLSVSYGDENEAYREANGHLFRALTEARRKLHEMGYAR